VISLLIGAVFVLLLVAGGWWPMRWLCGHWLGSGLAGRAALAMALGAALNGLVQLLLSAFGVPAGPLVPVLLAAPALAAFAIPDRNRGRTTAARRLPPALVALLLLVGLLGTGVSVGLPFSADGSRIWAAKSRELALHGASRAPSLHDTERAGVHRRYPLLAPALLAPVFALSPPDAASGPKAVLAALHLSLLGVLALLLSREGARGRVLLAVFLTMPFLVRTEVRESAVSGGYVDGLDALFLLLTVVGLDRLRRATSDGRDLLLTALCGAALASTKMEGAVELLIAMAAWLAVSRSGRRLVALAAVTILLLVPTLVLRAGVTPEPFGFSMQRLADGSLLAARSVPVALGLAGLVLDVSSFGLLPPLLLLWLAVGTAAPERRDTRRLALLMLAGTAAFLALSYLTTAMHATRHIATSGHRLVWHWLPAATWLVARLGSGSDEHGC
jgi:hypothetical protein